MTADTKKYRTITLTNRPPVRIVDAGDDSPDWGRIAVGRYDWHDGEVRSQANRTRKGFIAVRTDREDKRAIVYGVADYSTTYQGEADAMKRGGYLLETTDPAKIIEAIHKVARDIDGIDGIDTDALARECIADLPAEDI